MPSLEQRGHARAFLQKAEEYLASAQDSLDLRRFTPAAGGAIHAGINAKDAIVVSLTGSTIKGKDHAIAAKELGRALGPRPGAESVTRALRELVAAKADVEYGTDLLTRAKAAILVRRAATVVESAVQIVRLGR